MGARASPGTPPRRFRPRETANLPMTLSEPGNASNRYGIACGQRHDGLVRRITVQFYQMAGTGRESRKHRSRTQGPGEQQEALASSWAIHIGQPGRQNRLDDFLVARNSSHTHPGQGSITTRDFCFWKIMSLPTGRATNPRPHSISACRILLHRHQDGICAKEHDSLHVQYPWSMNDHRLES
jgi:hypothetical protein